jgi:simple sugar transport system ATP-binding protein
LNDTGSAERDPIVRLKDVKVRFGNIISLDGVDFEVGRHEVVGLLGNNGAGKSTLIKTLLGFHPRTSGEMFLEGRQVNFRSPREARAAGIETVFQDFSLAEGLSVVQNFFIGRELSRGGAGLGLQETSRMEKTAEEVLRELGLKKPVTMQSKVSSLSGGERQLIAIGRALFFVRTLLILDEPTSALSESAVLLLRQMVKMVKARGISIIFATHSAPEVFAVADRFVILDNGRVYANLLKGDTDLSGLEKLLISRRLSAVKEMAAGVAHQVRNPLGVLKVSVELIRKKLAAAGTEGDLDDITKVMLSEIDNLNHVISNFIDFAHQREPLKAPSSIREVIKESFAALPLGSFPDIDIHVEIPENIEPYPMDANLMKQALSNLIMNAIDASGERGAVQIKASPRGRYLCIEVRDWGRGIPEDQRHRIFMPFFTTKTSGTGLGLSIAHRIIEQHNGTINVLSTPGKGATFQIIL